MLIGGRILFKMKHEFTNGGMKDGNSNFFARNRRSLLRKTDLPRESDILNARLHFVLTDKCVDTQIEMSAGKLDSASNSQGKMQGGNYTANTFNCHKLG